MCDLFLHLLRYWRLENDKWLLVTGKRTNQSKQEINGFEWQSSYFLSSFYEGEKKTRPCMQQFSLKALWLICFKQKSWKVSNVSTPIHDLPNLANARRVEEDYRFVHVVTIQRIKLKNIPEGIITVKASNPQRHIINWYYTMHCIEFVYLKREGSPKNTYSLICSAIFLVLGAAQLPLYCSIIFKRRHISL